MSIVYAICREVPSPPRRNHLRHDAMTVALMIIRKARCEAVILYQLVHLARHNLASPDVETVDIHRLFFEQFVLTDCCFLLCLYAY